MGRREELVELAALLDGELDDRRAEQLYARIKADPELMAEFEAQRQVKLALGQLAEVEAPGYIHARVMGQIGARRGQVAAWRWRTAAAAIGGFAVCLLLVGGVFYFGQRTDVNATRPAADIMLGSGAYERQPRFGEPAAGRGWRELSVPAGADEEVVQFLEFANRAHGYRRMLNTAEALRPDLSSAILVLEGTIELNGDPVLVDEGGAR